MKKPRPTRHEMRWDELYGTACESDCTVECRECGETMLGDGPPVQIICLNCWKANHPPDPIGELMDAGDKAGG